MEGEELVVSLESGDESSLPSGVLVAVVVAFAFGTVAGNSTTASRGVLGVATVAVGVKPGVPILELEESFSISLPYEQHQELLCDASTSTTSAHLILLPHR